MDISESNIICNINLEWMNNQGVMIKKINYKTAGVKIVRSDSQELFIEVIVKKSTVTRFSLKSVNVHNKFMSEGKASIVFQEDKCTMYISNAPPASLLSFLRTIFVKMTGQKCNENSNASLSTQLLTNSKTTFEEISPVTVVDLNKVKNQISRTTDTTPSPTSRKRKLNDRHVVENGKAAKKLYTEVINETLNEEQQKVYDACMAGHNVFFTGSAGTGKSFLLRKIISALPPDTTFVTASTGVAACHIGGMTLHSFARIGTAEGTLERCYQLASKPQVAQVWRKCKHLIIDEISMLECKFFTAIEAVARYIRNNEKPFGGIQLILSGDFLQLPPVNKKTSEGNQSKFCFQSPAWDKCIKINFELRRVHRQTDIEFIDILNNIRVGRVTPEIVQKLTNTANQKIEENGILATRLCAQNADADILNEHKLKSLNGESKTFIAKDSDQTYSKILDQQTPVPGRLDLKIGAQVMLLKNKSVSGGLVNGARGIVVDFKNDLPVVQFRNNKLFEAAHENWIVKTVSGAVISRTQVPLKLAWAFSIHKSQGLTLDCVEMFLSGVFEAGQAYVALSRAQSLKTLRVLDFQQKHVWANPEVLKFYRNLRLKIDQCELIPLGGFKNKSLISKLTDNKKPKIDSKSKLSKFKPLVTIN